MNNDEQIQIHRLWANINGIKRDYHQQLADLYGKLSDMHQERVFDLQDEETIKICGGKG